MVLKKRSGIIIILIMTIILPFASAAAPDTFASTKQIPKAEIIDLIIDGSINPVRKNITKDFDFITKLHFELDYESATWIPTNFAASAPLTNGTSTIAGSTPLFDGNFTQNDKVYLVSDVAVVLQDDKAPKLTHVYGLINLFEMIPPCGLAYETDDSLYFVVRDNLTDTDYKIEEFQVVVMGFKWEDDTGVERAAPNNPFIYFADFIQKNLFPEIFFFFVAIIVLVVFIKVITLWKN